MKIAVTQALLDSSLTFLSEIVERRSTMPILGCVLLRAEEGKLFLSATDLTVSARTSITASVEVSGSALVNAKKLQDMVRSLTGTVVIESVDKTEHIRLGSGKAKFKLPGLNPTAAPEWPGTVVKDEGTEVRVQDFVKAVKSIMFAIPDEGGRYVLDGFLISGGDFVATDGWRLPIFWAEWAAEIPEVMIPRRAGQLLVNMLEGEGRLRIAQSERGILFKFGPWEMFSMKKEGRFPAYKTMLPVEDDFTVRATFSAILFAEHLHRALICTDDDHKLVRLEFTDGRVTFNASSRAAEEALDEMAISGKGNLVIGFNCKGLIEVLETMDGEVSFSAKDNESPAILRRTTDYSCVVAPMRIQ